MITLKNTTESLVATLDGANKHDFVAEYVDYAAEGAMDVGRAGSETSTYSVSTANRTIVSAPPSGVVRVIKSLFIRNTTGNSTTVLLEKVSGSTPVDYAVGPTITLASQEGAGIDDRGVITRYTSAGLRKADA